jgi:hypothetical protein
MLRKIVLFIAFTLATPLLLFSGHSFASSLYSISGLTGGTEISGYYTSPPTITITLNSSYPEPCVVNGGTIPGNGIISLTLSSLTPINLNGPYNWQILEDSVSNALLITNDGNWHDGHIIDGCNWNGPNPNWVVVWSQNIKYDMSPPTISIKTPYNNTNFPSSTDKINITGDIADQGSGIKSVTVNGVNAEVNGNSFSARIPINFGLNTISATATSNVNSTATSQQINVFRYESTTSGGPTNTTPGTMNTDSSKNISSSNSANKGLSSNSEEKISTKVANSTTVSQNISTPVKAGITAGAAASIGLATASYLGYIPYRRIGFFITKLFIR